MQNYTRLDFPWPCHLNEETKMLSVFCANKALAGSVMKKAMKVFPATLVRFVSYEELGRLHGG